MKYISSAIIGAAYASLWWAYVIWKNDGILVVAAIIGILAIIILCFYAYVLEA